MRRFELVTNDVDRAHQALRETYCDHEVRLRGDPEHFAYRQLTVAAGPLAAAFRFERMNPVSAEMSTYWRNTVSYLHQAFTGPHPPVASPLLSAAFGGYRTPLGMGEPLSFRRGVPEGLRPASPAHAACLIFPWRRVWAGETP